MKKLALCIFTVFCAFALSGTAMAAYSWDTCAIERLGVTGDSDNVFKVTSCGTSGNNSKWFTITKQKDTTMATLLTAISLGKKVKMQADFGSSSYYKGVESVFLDQ